MQEGRGGQRADGPALLHACGGWLGLDGGGGGAGATGFLNVQAFSKCSYISVQHSARAHSGEMGRWKELESGYLGIRNGGGGADSGEG